MVVMVKLDMVDEWVDDKGGGVLERGSEKERRGCAQRCTVVNSGRGGVLG